MHDHEHYDHPEVYARCIRVNLDQQYRSTLVDLLSGIADNLKRRGYSLIGHIKLAAQDDSGAVFYTSIVDYTTIHQCRGELHDLRYPVTVKINAILYQVEETDLQKIVDKELEILTGASCKVERAKYQKK
jgi:hypothetical protein